MKSGKSTLKPVPSSSPSSKSPRPKGCSNTPKNYLRAISSSSGSTTGPLNMPHPNSNTLISYLKPMIMRVHVESTIVAKRYEKRIVWMKAMWMCSSTTLFVWEKPVRLKKPVTRQSSQLKSIVTLSWRMRSYSTSTIYSWPNSNWKTEISRIPMKITSLPMRTDSNSKSRTRNALKSSWTWSTSMKLSGRLSRSQSKCSPSRTENK